MRRTLALVLPLLLAASGAAAASDGWTTIDYGAIVERRAISHSGETAGELIDALAGRPLPPPGERPADLARHRLLDPLVERYAFVLPDAVDSRRPLDGPPWLEVGLLWDEGAAQPAWAELLRARRYLIESDGAGRMRAFLPLDGEPWRQEVPPLPSEQAGEAALRQAWPVVRLVVAAERRRLGGDRSLELIVHPYRHLPARSSFHLGLVPRRVAIDDTRPSGFMPPVDLAAWRALLDGGRRLEGGRLEPDGGLTLFASDAEAAPTLLGRPLALADVAAAYRAVFRGGLAEPYMSLDRGFSPQTAIVNYGGRLRDTALGLVSLRCDVRFKTFSMGLDIERGTDRRDEVRDAIPGFRTHLEALAAHPESAGLTGQQTRLWFYPDDVDLTLSPAGDLMAMRRVRMSAASERVESSSLTVSAGGTDREDPPWTRATVAGIDRHYDTLATIFPELADLDEVVRLLAFFTWLRDADAAGWLVPELDALLDVELPPLTTPRTYPQLLSYDALPPAGSGAAVEVIDRAEVGAALERLDSSAGPLTPRRRFARSARLLDPSDPRHASLVAAFRNVDPETAEPGLLDLLAFRAERLRMHQTVLATLPPDVGSALDAREAAGEELRRFSLAIGGLDLGMGSALDRARRRAVAGDEVVEPRSVPARQVEAWRRDPVGLPTVALPQHGPGAGRPHVTSTPREDGGRIVEVRYADDGPGVRVRRLALDDASLALSVARVDAGGALIAYRFEGDGDALRVVGRTPPAPAPTPSVDFAALPPGLAALEIVAPEDPAVAGVSEASTLGLRLGATVDGRIERLEAEVPRPVLQRLVLGRAVDPTPGQPLGGLAPLPPVLGGPRALMVAARVPQRVAPWEATVFPVPGEEDPATIAVALNAWWRASSIDAPPQHAFVGVDPLLSPGRWIAHAGVGSAVLVLPPEGFGRPAAADRARLADAWGGRVVERLDADDPAELVVIASSEPPGAFGRRLRALARREAMGGRALLAWPLSGPVRPDLPASLLDEGLGVVGVVDESLVVRRRRDAIIGELARGVPSDGGRRRVESLPGPVAWYY